MQSDQAVYNMKYIYYQCWLKMIIDKLNGIDLQNMLQCFCFMTALLLAGQLHISYIPK